MTSRGALLALILVAGCTAPHPPADARLAVVTTTTVLASMASEVAGPDAAVTSLLPPGVSPETFEPAPADAARIHDAAVVVANGAGLETWLDKTLANARRGSAGVVVCTDGLPVSNHNPHLWLDPEFARRYVARMRDAFSAADPAHAAGYRARAERYDARLLRMERAIRGEIATIPSARRAMIVEHDAWPYFAARFGLRIIGQVVDQPGREPTPGHLAALVDAARAAHVRVLFTEPEYDPRLIQAVARSAGIERVATLYDDSVGTAPATADYVTMLMTDAATIARALR